MQLLLHLLGIATTWTLDHRRADLLLPLGLVAQNGR
jgi:hypothetical protein